MSFGGTWRIVGEESDHRLWVGTPLPERCLGAAAQKRNARPARIGVDEGAVARKIVRTIFAAQDHPFNELARQWIGDGICAGSRFVLAILAYQVERLFHRRQIKRRCRRGRGRSERRHNSRGHERFCRGGWPNGERSRGGIRRSRRLRIRRKRQRSRSLFRLGGRTRRTFSRQRDGLRRPRGFGHAPSRARDRAWLRPRVETNSHSLPSARLPANLFALEVE